MFCEFCEFSKLSAPHADKLAIRIVAVSVLSSFAILFRNVLGLMPHPERACDPATGGVEGRAMLQALLN